MALPEPQLKKYLVKINHMKKQASLTSLALLLVLAANPEPLAALFKTNPVLAQATSNVSASTAPNGKTVRIDSSSSMKVMNESHKQQLEQRPGTNVQVSYDGTDAALQSLLDGKTDLAAVGRPLTAQEKAKGFVVVPQGRHKIAIVVGTDNPFTGNLTFEQFAQIFRGEITDWSQVGGSPGPIQLIDRPAASDTRQAFQSYSVFKQAPFVAATNAVKSEDSTEAVIKKLGTRGISYAIADQVTNTPGVRIVPMHKTLPSDPRYPFSQPLAYVYKGPTASPVVAAFLGDVAVPTAASPEAVAPVSPQTAAPTSPQTAVAPAPVPVTAEKGFPWLWLLLIPLLGGLLWWLLKRSRPAPAIAPVAAPKVVPISPPAPVAPVVLDEQAPDIKLYEERLVANKTRQKVADVAVGKRVQTESAQVSVPIEKERVVIERTTPTDTETVKSSDVAFGVGQARIDTYEEIPEIRKEAFVREEINVSKEVERETVTAQETLRREELDIDIKGNPVIDTDARRPNNLP